MHVITVELYLRRISNTWILLPKDIHARSATFPNDPRQQFGALTDVLFQLAVETVHVDVVVVIVIGGGFLAKWWCASGVLAAPNIQQVCGGSHDEGHGDEKCS